MKSLYLLRCLYAVLTLFCFTFSYAQYPPDTLNYSTLIQKAKLQNNDGQLAKLHLGYYFLTTAKKPDSTLYFLKHLKNELPNWDDSYKAVYYNLKGRYFFDQSILDSAKVNFDKSLLIAKDLDLPILKANNYNSKAVIAVYGSNYKEGMNQMLKCHEILEKMQDHIGLSMNEYNLGMLYVFTKNYNRAKYYHYKSIKRLENIKAEPKEISMRYGALCNIYLNEKKIDSAQYCLNYIINNGDEKYNNYYYFKGRIALAKQQNDVAIDYFNKSITLMQDHGRNMEIATRLNKIAQAHLNLNKPKVTLEYLKKADSLIDSDSFVFLRRNQDSLYYVSYQLLGDNLNSLKYLKRYQNGVTKSLAANKIQEAGDIESKYQIKKKKVIIKNQEGIINNFKSKGKLFVTFSIGLVLIVLLILVVNYKSKVKLRKEKAVIETEYKKINSKNLDLEDKLRAVSLKIKENKELHINKRYQNSSLKEEQRQEFMEKILEIMATKRPYLDPKLTQNTLSEQLQISKHHFSEVININFGKNFYGFINLYRVEEAKKIINTDDKNLTMIAIAYNSGFNSKASFNRVFKEVTGITPSEYKKTFLPDSNVS
ncbi:hypothetical protein GCM10022393_09130 [Aquimarina addita]|uniref:HTH araC/xylS-type domain-containing protein n=1 Tax=Aquimarina addita TaxID=870485 RepID=A0ABP7XCG5_9FLAO